MGYSKIISKLDDIKNELEQLKSYNHKEGSPKLSNLRNKVQMIIRRIYPDHEKLNKKFFSIGARIYIKGMYQEYFITDINKVILAIDTIKEEFELFGFDDFTPVKEKTETEWKVGIKDAFFRKKKEK